MLAAGHADGCIRLWNTDDSKCIATLHSHSRAVTALAFNANGGYLASGSQDTDIIVWDVAGEVGMYKLHGHTNQVTSLAILDGQNKLISAGKDGFIRVWDLTAQFCMQTIPQHAGEILKVKLHGFSYLTVAGQPSVHCMCEQAYPNIAPTHVPCSSAHVHHSIGILHMHVSQHL